MEKNPLRLPDNVYDWLMRFTKYILPALGALYTTLANIFSWPYVEQVLSSIVGIETFFGVILGISNQQFKKEPIQTDGELVYNEMTGQYHADISDPESDYALLSVRAKHGASEN